MAWNEFASYGKGGEVAFGDKWIEISDPTGRKIIIHRNEARDLGLLLLGEEVKKGNQACIGVLRPVKNGMWSWGAIFKPEEMESLDDYERVTCDELSSDGTLTKTDELHGFIHDDRGQVYRIDFKANPGYPTYEIVWIEENGRRRR